MSLARNPILRGFNPDPSIVRVGKDYYIATSTFEWFPGVQIHHSTDLANWNLVARPLDRVSQLDLKAVPDSCGVWAPCLSYDNGTFYLVYSNVKSFDGMWKDTPNYLVTSNNIMGPWSDPIFLGSSGFDGSLFHDDDGRKWFLSMLMDHRRNKFFGGIILQEYSSNDRKLVGSVHHIFEGTDLGSTEGPHLYKKDGYYYLLTAEGGTEYKHAISIARSKEIIGPYELHPENPIVTCYHDPSHGLQKSGHGDFVSDENGNWYVVFLVGRPLTERGRCILGRETAIENIDWKENDWPRLSSENKLPSLEVEIPAKPKTHAKNTPSKDDFDSAKLNVNFQSLRVPITDEWMNLTERVGFLRLYGRESLSSLHSQSMIARRLQSFHIEVTTCVDFEPENFQQMAGLVCYYNTGHYHYLAISFDQISGNRVIQLFSSDNFVFSEPLEGAGVPLETGNVELKAHWNRDKIQFYFRQGATEWKEVGSALDGSILSDDYVANASGKYRAAFTGAFIGICCQDLSGQKNHADFDWFEYVELDEMTDY